MECWLTVGDVAEAVQLKQRTVLKLLRVGELRGAQLGGRAGWRVAESELRAFMESKVPEWEEDDEGE